MSACSAFVFFAVECVFCRLFFFFFNDTATTEIYTLSLHDALPILPSVNMTANAGVHFGVPALLGRTLDRKSTRLNSSHLVISYAVFCLKKKKKKTIPAGTAPSLLSYTPIASHRLPRSRLVTYIELS